MAILGQGVHLDRPGRIARFFGDQELSSRAWEVEPWLVGVLQFNPGISTKVMGKIKARAGAGQVAVMIGALASEGDHLSQVITCLSLPTVAISIDSQTGAPCGGWDPATANALSHVAFQPFSWPVLNDASPSYTDVKIYNGNEILFHWIFRGFRADTDLSVQQQFADEFFIKDICRGRVRLSVVVAAFQAGGFGCSPSNAEAVPLRSVPMAQ